LDENAPRPIRRRLFVVGCSRSGTTLSQRLLASHSRIHSFPETGVFLKALGMRGRVLPWVHLGLTAGKERKALSRLLARAGEGRGAAPPLLPPRRVILRRSLADVVGFLDALALGAGADVWVEKTPRHVLHAARIRELVPRSIFIHVVRDGRDVVASIVDRARRFPGRFPRQDRPGYGIRQWNRSLAATEEAMGREGHVVLSYHALASSPESTLKALCDGVGVEYEEGMLDPMSVASTFVTEDEHWKEQVNGPVSPAPSKFTDTFDEATREWIEGQLDWGFFREIEARTSGVSRGVWVSREGS
jgi:hypothetical protein